MEETIDFMGWSTDLTEADIRMMSPLAWAFMGDAVFEQLVRRAILKPGLSPNKLHRLTAKIVSAKGQSAFYEKIKEELTEGEQDIFRRGRNAHSRTMAKNMSVGEYRVATGLEAVFGYLYLLGRVERIQTLFQRGMEE